MSETQPRRFEFFFDFGSATSYLAWSQVHAVARECQAELLWRPMLLGGVFKATGNGSPMMVPAKAAWMLQDMGRWARRYGLPMRMNTHFPVNTLLPMRVATGLQQRAPERLEAFVEACFRAMWERNVNIGDAAALAQALAPAGFAEEEMAALAADAIVKAALITATEAAVARGVFGAPTFFVGTHMFFGNDRLDMLREALLAPAA
jgi:2-hydroxychromene-2-carboxylate isomerase